MEGNAILHVRAVSIRSWQRLHARDRATSRLAKRDARMRVSPVHVSCVFCKHPLCLPCQLIASGLAVAGTKILERSKLHDSGSSDVEKLCNRLICKPPQYLSNVIVCHETGLCRTCQHLLAMRGATGRRSHWASVAQCRGLPKAA